MGGMSASKLSESNGNLSEAWILCGSGEDRPSDRQT